MATSARYAVQIVYLSLKLFHNCQVTIDAYLKVGDIYTAPCAWSANLISKLWPAIITDYSQQLPGVTVFYQAEASCNTDKIQYALFVKTNQSLSSSTVF